MIADLVVRLAFFCGLNFKIAIILAVERAITVAIESAIALVVESTILVD